MSKTCLSSEGKGRIESLFGKYVFNAETFIDQKSKKLKLEISVPLVGSELVELDYGKTASAQSFFRSKIYLGLMSEARQRGKEEEAKVIFQEFVVGVSRYLDFLHNPKALSCLKVSADKCQVAANESLELLEGRLRYWRQFATNHELLIVQTAEEDGKFRRLSMDLLHSESKLLSLNLFHSQCLE